MLYINRPRMVSLAARSACVGAVLITFALPSCSKGVSAAETTSATVQLYDLTGNKGEFESLGTASGWQGLPSRVRHIPTGMVLVLIEPGSAQLGSPDDELERDNDEVSQEVEITKPFYMGETEVSIAEWRAVCSDLPVDCEFTASSSLPVQGVSWHAAKEFVTDINNMGSPGWRLPSENEWAYACRAGTTTAFSFGDDVTADIASFNSEWAYGSAAKSKRATSPQPTRSFSANPWGLFDMHGNMWEWCEDCYFADPTSAAVKVVPGGPRVLRGGAWTTKGSELRSASREGYAPSSSGSEYGMRLVFSI
jgi:sulfatase modifying factor 1